MRNIKTVLIACMVLFVSACSTLNASTVANAVRGHQAFPGLSVAVQECVSNDATVRSEIVAPWNNLFDKWEKYSKLDKNADIVEVAANAQSDMREAKFNALFIEGVIIKAGIDCGPFVDNEWGNIKTTFSEIEAAVATSERIVQAIEVTTVIARIVQGKNETATRLE